MDYFAAASPGLESMLAEELEGIGLAQVAVEPGGVNFSGDARALAMASLHSGLAGAILARVGSFAARRFDVLVRKTKRLGWEDILHPGTRVEVRATCRKSKLYHSRAVEERVAAAIADALGPPQADGPCVPIAVRMLGDTCTISLDTSGEPLHRRGWRQQTAKAPLREDLARALLIASGWDTRRPLVDPLMGSGTLVIEAATMVRKLAPGRLRNFAFEHTKLVPPEVLARVRREAAEQVVDSETPIWGRDKMRGALEATQGNAARAGVLGDLDLDLGDLADAPWPQTRDGILVSNPPYGQRVGTRAEARTLLTTWARRLAACGEGWTTALVFAERGLARGTGLRLEPKLTTDHGGVKVEFMVGSASRKSMG